MKSAKDRMDIISAYQQLGSYRAAADACGTTHRTVKKIVDKFEADQAGIPPQPRAERTHNYDAVAEVVAERVEKSNARISAKRLLPMARASGYEGSGRNFRRLVSDAKALWRSNNHSGRRPAVWSPSEYLVIDWRFGGSGLPTCGPSWPPVWGPHTPARLGDGLILDLPVAPTRSLDAYKILPGRRR